MPRLTSCLLLAVACGMPASLMAVEDASNAPPAATAPTTPAADPTTPPGPAPAATAPAPPPAPPSQAVQDFQAAMNGNDSDAKRDAIKALVSSSAGDDDTVLPLLVQAVSDRQGHDAAVTALRDRTGLVPSPYAGQSRYPGYASGDNPADWNAWLADRTQDMANRAKIAAAEKAAKDAEKTANKALKTADAAHAKATDAAKAAGATGDATAASTTSADAPGTATTTADAADEKKQVPDDLGALNRVVFKNGSSLACYILTRRTDADGNLLTLRVVHPDGSGEETLDASLIARVESMH